MTHLVYYSTDRTWGHGGLWSCLHWTLQPFPLSCSLLISPALGGGACLSRLSECWLAEPGPSHSPKQSPVYCAQILPLGPCCDHLRWVRQHWRVWSLIKGWCHCSALSNIKGKCQCRVWSNMIRWCHCRVSLVVLVPVWSPAPSDLWESTGQEVASALRVLGLPIGPVVTMETKNKGGPQAALRSIRDANKVKGQSRKMKWEGNVVVFV